MHSHKEVILPAMYQLVWTGLENGSYVEHCGRNRESTSQVLEDLPGFSLLQPSEPWESMFICQKFIGQRISKKRLISVNSGNTNLYGQFRSAVSRMLLMLAVISIHAYICIHMFGKKTFEVKWYCIYYWCCCMCRPCHLYAPLLPYVVAYLKWARGNTFLIFASIVDGLPWWLRRQLRDWVLSLQLGATSRRQKSFLWNILFLHFKLLAFVNLRKMQCGLLWIQQSMTMVSCAQFLPC